IPRQPPSPNRPIRRRCRSSRVAYLSLTTHLLTTHPTTITRSARIHGIEPQRMSRLTTEARNPASEKIDTLSPLEIVRLMSEEDARVAEAVGREGEAIARAIEVIGERLR